MWSGISRQNRRSAPGGFVLLAPLLVLAALGCAGRSTSVVADDDDASSHGGSGARGGTGGAAGSSGRGGHGGAGGSVAGTGGTGGTGEIPFQDPGCPDAAAPAPTLECNVFNTPTGCSAGTVCKPQIEHPFGSGCDQQVLDMRCVTAGTTQQGGSCDGGMADCGDGLLCVIGAESGAHCLLMCPLDGSNRCPAGYVCNPTDADGIGVCG